MENQVIPLGIELAQLGQCIINDLLPSNGSNPSCRQARAVDLCRLNANDINLKIKDLSSSMYKSLSDSSQPYSSSTSSTSSGSRSSVSYSNPVNDPILPSPNPVSGHQLSYPTYPDVSMKKLPFFKLEETLLKPCSLQPKR